MDHAQRRAAACRGACTRRVPLDSVVDYFDGQGLDVVAVHEALDRLAAPDRRQAQVMTLRYFGRMTVAEIAGGWASRWRRSSRTGGWRGPGSPASSEGATDESGGWQRIGELFKGAVRIDPAGREE